MSSILAANVSMLMEQWAFFGSCSIFSSRHAATLMDRHARSRRRRLGGPTATPPSAPPRRRGRIDPMGRMWPVGDDHATTGGSPRVAPWPPPPCTTGGPPPCRREALAGLRLFGSRSLMAAPRLVPYCLPLPAAAKRRSRLFLEVCWYE